MSCTMQLGVTPPEVAVRVGKRQQSATAVAAIRLFARVLGGVSRIAVGAPGAGLVLGRRRTEPPPTSLHGAPGPGPTGPPRQLSNPMSAARISRLPTTHIAPAAAKLRSAPPVRRCPAL